MVSEGVKQCKIRSKSKPAKETRFPERQPLQIQNSAMIQVALAAVHVFGYMGRPNDRPTLPMLLQYNRRMYVYCVLVCFRLFIC